MNKYSMIALLVMLVSQAHCEEPSWLSLERGKQAYDSKNFGEALVWFDTAITTRHNQFSTASAKLAKILDTKYAKKSSDSIMSILSVFAEEDFIQRDYKKILLNDKPNSRRVLEALRKERLSDTHRAFIDILLLIYDHVSTDTMSDSLQKLLKTLSLLASYPEAEHWKGKVFFLEGELNLAESQYKRAYDMKASLEIPDEQYEILYDMAMIYKLKSDFVAWENVMTRISSEVDVKIDNFLRNAMVKTIVESSFDRFMTLYRIDVSYAINANSYLAQFYLDRGRPKAIEYAAISINMVLTQSIQLINKNNRDYTWTGLENFMKLSSSMPNVVQLLEELALMHKLLFTADALYIAGARQNAIKLWEVVAKYGKPPYNTVAQTRIKSPNLAVKTEQTQ